MEKLELKIPPPVYLLLAGTIMWVISRTLSSGAFDFGQASSIKWLFLAIGLTIDISSLLLFFIHKTTPSPLSPANTKQLVINGWYRYSRNPMYLGMVFLLLAWAIHIGNGYSLVGIPLFIWVLTQMQIKPEERILRDKFGAQYIEYCQQVRRWV